MDTPTDLSVFNAISVPLSDGTSFTIVHNLPLEGKGNIEEVLEEWILVTLQFSAEAFCLHLYVERQLGRTDRVAMTIAQFEQKFQLRFDDHFKAER